MQYELSEDNKRIRDIVRRVASEKVAPRAGEIDTKAEYPQDMFDLLKDLGLFTLPFDEKYGGMNSILSACARNCVPKANIQDLDSKFVIKIIQTSKHRCPESWKQAENRC